MAVRTAVGRGPYSIPLGFYAWVLVLGALLILGIIGFARQTIEGHQVTGLSDAAPWGLYITGFVFFVGTSAGATIIGMIIHAFGREDYARLEIRAIVVALVTLVAAILLIASDVGSIPRMIGLPWVWRNPTSMFFYTSISYYLFAGLLLAWLYYALKVRRGAASAGDKRMLKWIAIITGVFALVELHAPHGALFAVVIAREFWNTPLLPSHFASAALVTGMSIMLLMAMGHSWIGKGELVSRRTLAHMGVLLGWFIAITAVQDFFDFLVAFYGNQPLAKESWHALWTGHHIPISIVHVGGYIIVFLLLLSKRGRTVPGLAIAAVLALAAVAAFRYNLTAVGLDVPLFPFLPEVHYKPTWTEGSIVAGVAALAILAYSVVIRLLPQEKPAGSPNQG